MRQPLPTAQIDDERSSTDPVAQAIRNADLAALWSAIAALPQQQRDALLLREFGGLSYAELAGALAVTGSAVESLLFRARHGVRARLEAASAAFTGPSWLESLARLFGGIGGGMAPVAAKVAVVSVGAAVATGGYVAAPHVLRTPSRPAHPARTVPPRSLAAPAAVLVAETRPVASHASGRQEPSDGGEPAGADRSGGQESDRRAERSSTGEHSAGGSPASGDSYDGSPSPDPPVTVTVPLEGPSPAPGEPVATTDD